MRDAIAALKHAVQEGSAIDNILLAGGAAFFFRRELQRAFSKHTILEVEKPLFANVAGFYLGGRETLAGEARRASKRVGAAV